MPSYKNHAIFSLIAALLVLTPFFPEVFYLALAVMGSSIVDLDHPLRYRNLLLLGLLGVVLSLGLYFLGLSIVLGLILILLALIFLVSSHRGLMHSFFGVIIISLLLALFVYSSLELLQLANLSLNLSLVLITVFLGFIILNKQLLPFFLVLFLLGMFIVPSSSFNIYFTFLSFFLGALSHLALDMVTGSGVKLFSPISQHNFAKKTVMILLILWLGGIAYYYGFKIIYPMGV